MRQVAHFNRQADVGNIGLERIVVDAHIDIGDVDPLVIEQV